jgi:hypothetical protein
MEDYKYIYKDSYFNNISMKNPPPKPLQFELENIKTIYLKRDWTEPKFNLLDFLREIFKHNVLLGDVEFCMDSESVELYKRAENEKYPEQLLQYEEDMKIYQDELLKFDEIKKEENNKKLLNEREIKMKQLERLKKELGV